MRFHADTIISLPAKEMTLPFLLCLSLTGCACYIFASLFCMPKRKHLWNNENAFFFQFGTSFCSWDNQILTFSDSQMSWGHQMPKHETRNT